jgi:predicted RNase H-like HicB family nuclease
MSIAYCAEVPGANGQGRTREECLQNLREAITFILEHRREDSLRALPPDAERELVAGRMKRESLLRDLRVNGCVLRREGKGVPSGRTD